MANHFEESADTDGATDAHPGYKQPATARARTVRILHISDTHSLHRSIEKKFPLPEADILIHTGDMTDKGQDHELADFNAWLGELRESKRFPAIVVIAGNHEWKGLKDGDYTQEMLAGVLNPKEYMKAKLSNAHYVLDHEVVEICGIRIFGSAWCPWHLAANPDIITKVTHAPGLVEARKIWESTGQQKDHRFDEIPLNLDILLTHGPAHGILDRLESSWSNWGSSRLLLEEIRRKQPKVHLFGHLHEQRGYWVHVPGQPFKGGVEYEAKPGVKWETFPPPPPDYPCELIACTAMKNHPGLDGNSSHIAGPGRLILAEGAPGAWNFRLA